MRQIFDKCESRPDEERVANRKGGEARSRSVYSHVTAPIYAY